MSNLKEIARRCFDAYAQSDRAAAEEVIADDFHFTSPLDHRLDRETYFKRCWPNNERITGFRFVRMIEDGDQVIVTYEGMSTSGKGFRNTEVLTIRGGKIVEVEVYFGWSIPHKAPENGFVDAAPGSDQGELQTIFGHVSCADLGRSLPWFEKLFARPADARPMDGLAEWHHGSGGMQLFENADHAGSSSLTLIVRSLEAARSRLRKAGLEPGEIENANSVRLMRLCDPDGNLVVVAEAKSM